MSIIDYGFQLFFGIVEANKLPPIPDGWRFQMSQYDFARVVSPSGREFFFGGNVFRERFDIPRGNLSFGDEITLDQLKEIE